MSAPRYRDGHTVGDSEAVTVLVTWRKAGNIEEFKRRSQHTLHRAKSEAVSQTSGRRCQRFYTKALCKKRSLHAAALSSEATEAGTGPWAALLGGRYRGRKAGAQGGSKSETQNERSQCPRPPGSLSRRRREPQARAGAGGGTMGCTRRAARKETQGGGWPRAGVCVCPGGTGNSLCVRTPGDWGLPGNWASARARRPAVHMSLDRNPDPGVPGAHPAGSGERPAPLCGEDRASRPCHSWCGAAGERRRVTPWRDTRVPVATGTLCPCL